MLGCYLAHLFLQDRALFLLGPANDRFYAANVQRDPSIPSSVLSAPHVSSPCLGANEEIDLRATGSPSCWSFHLHQTNQMWGEEPLELLVAEGYMIAVGAKPSHIVDETFCSIPTYGANCCYWIVRPMGHQRRDDNLQKSGSDGSVPIASPMIKSTKGWRRERTELAQLELHTFPSGGEGVSILY